MMLKRRQAQRGMTMVTVVFLLVVLASAAAFIVQITQLQQASVTLRFLEARATQLAYTGVERGKYYVYNQAGPSGCSPGNPHETTTLFTADDDPTLVGFSLKTTIDCHRSTNRIVNWTVVSEATFREPGDPLHVNRALKVHFSHGL